MIQLFGTVLYDRIRIIEEFPKIIGSYTNVSNEKIFLGGQSSNTFICLIRWLNESNDKNKNQFKYITKPIKKDSNGDIVLKILEPYNDHIIYSKIIERDEENEILKSLPGIDIYVCKEKERTMFGYGILECNQLAYEIKERILNDCLLFGNQHWISLDGKSTPIYKEIFKHSIKTKTNLYVMDQDINESINELISECDEGIKENFKSLSLIFQSSSDRFGNKGDKNKLLNTINQWLSLNNGINKNFLFILTDSKNGFAIGGTFRNYITGESIYIEPYWINSFYLLSPDQVIDSTGAGDCFRAGLIYSLIHLNQSLNDSLKFASISGALNCLNYGGNDKTPKLIEIKKIINN